MTEFWEQYKHPLWQKKRLEMLASANFACDLCGGKDRQLHVHHKQYFKDKKIWEYSADEMQVLCEACHSCAHEINDDLKEILCCLDPIIDIPTVIGLISGYFGIAGFEERCDSAIYGKLANVAYGMLDEDDVNLLCSAINNLHSPHLSVHLPPRRKLAEGFVD